MSLGGVVAAAKRGHANMFTPAVNPSVSLPADSSPYTGEPGGRPPGREIRLPPPHVNPVCRAATGNPGVHLPAAKQKSPRVWFAQTDGAFAEKEIIFFVCGTRPTGALP